MKKNNLAEGNPELAKEWHPTLNGDLTPEDVAGASNKKFWWQCSKGHQWEAIVSNRKKGSGCPYCSNKKALPGYNDLVTANPELARDWHPTMNGALAPEKVRAGSGKIVWWQCDKNHEWMATISSRSGGCGCPFCSGRRAIEGETDLATTNPELAKEWHPSLNGDKSPRNFSCGSGWKAWWQCKEYTEHQWRAVINSRHMGAGCPFCSNQKVLQGYNDLATIHPELAKEWHPTLNGSLTPCDVTPRCEKKVWWQCNENKEHQWEASIGNRNATNATNCPYCSNQKVLTGYNDLTTTNPELAKEWHPTKNGDLTAEKITCGSNKKAWWQCRKGHEWKALINSRNRGCGCPKCSAESKTSFPEQTIYYYLNKSLSFEVENRATVCGVEVDIFIPSWNIGIEYDGLYFHGSEKSMASERKKNEILSTSGIQLIRIKESKRLSGKKKNIIYCVTDSQYKYLNSMLISLSEILSEINGGPLFFDINIERDRIEIMEQYIGIEKANSVAGRNPLLAREWHSIKNGSIKPEHLSESSNKKVWWQCTQNKEHQWEAMVSSRSKGSGCPYCSGRNVLKGESDLATTNPELAIEWHPVKNKPISPESVGAGANKKVWWQCGKGHEWAAYVYNRKKGDGCPYCSGRRAIKGENDLATTNPHLATEWHPSKNGELKPADVLPFSGEKIWWQCNKKHEWKAIISNRTKGSGCPYCSNKKVVIGYNDLAAINQVLAKEWHQTLNGALTPYDVTAISNKKVWWQCNKHKEHQWQSTVGSRMNGSGCPYCINQNVLPFYNDLATTHPKLAAEWHPNLNGDLTPSDVVAGSGKTVWWQCAQNHVWQTRVVERKIGKGRCPECAKQSAPKH